MNNKSLGRGTDKVKWIAGDKRQLWAITHIQNTHLIGHDNFSTVDGVMIGTSGVLYSNIHAGADIPKWAEIRITMARKSHISKTAGQSRPGYMANATQQAARIIIRKNWHCQRDRRDGKLSQKTVQHRLTA